MKRTNNHIGNSSKKIFLIMKILLIIGMLISLFLLYEHFSTTPSTFCVFGKEFNCNIVNKSPYSNLDGFSYLLTIDLKLPFPLIDISGRNFFLDFLTTNAFLGFLAFLLLLLLISAKAKNKGILGIKNNMLLKWIKRILIFSVAYGFYLFLIQHFVLKTYCIFCLALDLIIIISLISVWRIKNE